MSTEENNPEDLKKKYKDQNDTWVDREVPKWLQPYLKLSRIDRPIGEEGG